MHSSVHTYIASSHTCSVQITFSFWGCLDVKFWSLGFIQSRTARCLRPAPGFSIKVIK